MGAVIVKASVQDWYNAFSTARSLHPAIMANTHDAMGITSKVATEFWRCREFNLKCGTSVSAQEALAQFYNDRCHLRLAKDGNVVVGGYAVLQGELLGLWSVPGEDGRGHRGDWLIRAAVADGAERLDCFDGFLPALYKRNGFEEVLREPFFPMGAGPDVVWMRLSV